MTKSVKPSAVEGNLPAPASKSVAQRAIVAALLATGHSTLRHLTLCNDTQAALQAAATLGATITQEGDSYRIASDFFAANTAPKTVFCGESGLLTRMLAPVVALLASPVQLAGEGSLLSRPLTMVEDALRELGAQASAQQGLMPLNIQGKLCPGPAHIDGSAGSQVLTGLLMALPLADGDSTLHVHQLKSKPYIDLTINLLQQFGITIEHEDHALFRIPGHQRYTPCAYNIEGDWSGASCLLVAGAVAGSIAVSNLDTRSPQADVAILRALQLAGSEARVEQGAALQTIRCRQSALRAFEFDATHCPDLFPALVALAACCEGVTTLGGALRLTHKESNRALTLQQEFGTLGVKVELAGDQMRIHGGGAITGGRVCAHNDHRIAMALATAALRATHEVLIDEAESVEKSYPGFWGDLEGVQVRCG